jgi:hypothetical protein
VCAVLLAASEAVLAATVLATMLLYGYATVALTNWRKKFRRSGLLPCHPLPSSVRSGFQGRLHHTFAALLHHARISPASFLLSILVRFALPARAIQLSSTRLSLLLGPRPAPASPSLPPVPSSITPLLLLSPLAPPTAPYSSIASERLLLSGG